MSIQQSITLPSQSEHTDASEFSSDALECPGRELGITLHSVEDLTSKWMEESERYLSDLDEFDLRRDLAELTLLPFAFLQRQFQDIEGCPQVPIGRCVTNLTGCSFEFQSEHELQQQDISPELLRLKFAIDDMLKELDFGPQYRPAFMPEHRPIYTRNGHPNLGMLTASLLSEFLGGHLIMIEDEVAKVGVYTVSEWSMQLPLGLDFEMQILEGPKKVIDKLYSFCFRDARLDNVSDPVGSACVLAARCGVGVKKLDSENAVFWLPDSYVEKADVPYGVHIHKRKAEHEIGRPLVVSWLHNARRAKELVQRL